MSCPSVSIGPVASAPYLDQGSCSDRAFKDVILIAVTGQKYRFNQLLLASTSATFREVLVNHFSSPHYLHGERVCITTEFEQLELDQLHELCHYGQLTLSDQSSAEPCLKALGVDLATFSMTSQVFNAPVVKMEVEEDDRYGDPEEESSDWDPAISDFPYQGHFLDLNVSVSKSSEINVKQASHQSDSGYTIVRTSNTRTGKTPHPLSNKAKKPFRCPICDRGFSQKVHMENHVKNIHLKDSEKPFKCETCEYATTAKGMLDKHIRLVHFKERPFKCPLCETAFGQRTHRDAHINAVHNKIKPHKCELCDYSATNSGLLKKHIQIVHHKVKPFVCDICQMRFGQKAHLKAHINSKHQQ